jgi:DnaJ-class molecular chaperone
MLACSNRIFAWRYFASTSSGLSAQRLRQAYFSLDLEENAEIEEVRQRYAQLIRRFHPDTGGKEVGILLKYLTQSTFRLILNA